MRLSFIDNDMLCRSGIFKAGLTIFPLRGANPSKGVFVVFEGWIQQATHLNVNECLICEK
jgi:hypothetical protein